MESKDEFFAAFPLAPVAVPVLGQTVHILPLSYADIIRINAAPDPAARSAVAFVRSVCSPSGVRLFTDEDAETINALVPLPVSEAVFPEIRKLNRLGDDAGKADSPAGTN